MSTFALVKSVRAEIMADIDAGVADAEGILEYRGAFRMAVPTARIGGEWDWYWHLTRPERIRLRRAWTSDMADGPDLIADRFNLAVDEAMAEWLRCTRIIDIGRSMRIRKSGSGYVPGSASVGGLEIDDLFPHPIYRLADLFAPSPACIDYLAEVAAEEDRLREEETWENRETSYSVTDMMSF